METHFDSKGYVRHLALELIRNFEFSGSLTTPGFVGTSREKEVCRKLELLLPGSIGVGSGCIIDSYGNTSKQIDTILYEKELCPVFSVNGTAETTYYPCEGVIAAGEVKSRLNSTELADIFAKAYSVKKLQRHSVSRKANLRNDYHFPFRKYGMRESFEGAQSEDYDQKNKSTDQIYCFALCGELDMTVQSLQTKFKHLLQECNYEKEVNLICLLNHGLVFYHNELDNQIKYSIRESDSFFITAKRENNFEFLISTLHHVVNAGRTVEIDAYRRYLVQDGGVSMEGGVRERININHQG
jgi:hypothetical protein